ncbi:MAG TPA: TIGR03013 family XrtA/PEP-CTERM system glycosyltransferase [Magnetospirillum sp.]|nr:TIGR03013 family XrtA/PEP-CTERM system glycosyltransferase [Magnetospirillum sp.]
MKLRIFRHYLSMTAVALAVCETVLLFALLNWAGAAFPAFGQGGGVPAALVCLVAVAGMGAVGLYDRQFLAELRQVALRATVVFPLIMVSVSILLAGAAWLRGDGASTRDVALCAGVLAGFFLLLLALRGTVFRVADSFDGFRRRVVVLAPEERVRALKAAMGNRRAAQVAAVPHPVKPGGLAALCLEQRIDEVVIAPGQAGELPVGDILACRLHGIHITHYARFWECETGQVDLSPGPSTPFEGYRPSALQAGAKRALDVALSLWLLLLTLPLSVLTAVAIRLESAGPIFYRQERTGLGGEPFMILKFRSMRTDAEKDGPVWAAKGDARVTRVGRVIRILRIDEIPQVINVLKGEMSFVGPRPERPVFVERLARTIPYYDRRHEVKPGITGWAQINYPYGATDEDARHKLAYDLYYIKNASMFLDAIIVLQTVKVLLWNSGAR